MSRTEQQLIQKAAAGDRMAFRQLVLDHSQALFRLAWRVCGDESLADEIVQDAFVKAWRALGDFRGDASFASWMHRITVNTAMSALRKQARRQKHETPELGQESAELAAPEHAPDRQIDIRRQTRAAMMHLSDAERSALLLKHYEGHSIREIADMLGMTPNACKQTVFRAVRKMRERLQPLVTT